MDQEGIISCSPVLAKAKLAPLKPISIPRLELSAAVVATKLDENAIIKYVQSTAFDPDQLKNKLFNKLSPNESPNGQLHVGGWLSNGSVPEETKHTVFSAI